MSKSIDINTCTLQEVCDYAVQMIVQQGERAIDDNEDACIYGNAKGQHCVIGWLLDHDDPTIMEFEGPLRTLIDEYKQAIPEQIRLNMKVFEPLQKFHDNESKLSRANYLKIIENQGIDTSGDHWQQWVMMGAETVSFHKSLK